MFPTTLAESRMYVLGARGMLGQMVCQYFESKVAELVPFPNRFLPGDAGRTVESLAACHPDIVINCAGAIKQRTSNDGELYYANALLPLELHTLLPPTTVLVHPSTDCVFSGRASSAYPSTQPSDAEDVYGWSKYLGEQALLSRPFTFIPRVSIIGPDSREGGPGLLNWFLHQPDDSVLNGFTNHHWNGITTLEWCHQIERRLRTGGDFSDTRATRIQLGTEDAISKHDLLLAFAKVFRKRLEIREHASSTAVYRVLAPDAFCPPILQQLEELATWMTHRP